MRRCRSRCHNPGRFGRRAIDYQITIEVRPGYVHATVKGARTPENALRFLQDVCAACVENGKASALLEMHLGGASLDTGGAAMAR